MSCETDTKAMICEKCSKPVRECWCFAETLPAQTWCKCGHISGQHGAAYPHRCACDGNRWIDGHGSICDCQAFEARAAKCECGHAKSAHPTNNRVGDGFCTNCRCNEFKEATEAQMKRRGGV